MIFLDSIASSGGKLLKLLSIQTIKQFKNKKNIKNILVLCRRFSWLASDQTDDKILKL